MLSLVVSLLEGLPLQAFTFLTKVSLSRLLLLEVCNVQSIFRKPHAANPLVVSDFTLDCSFKVKLWRLGIKVTIFFLIIASRGSQCSQPLGNHLTSTLLLSSLLFAVNTFVHLATDLKIA